MPARRSGRALAVPPRGGPRPAGTSADSRRRRPRLGLRPRQRAEVDRLLGVDRDRRPDRREIHQHMPEPRRAHGQREGQQQLASSSSHPPSRASAPRHLDVGRRQHARVVERAQRLGRRRGRAGRRCGSRSRSELMPRAASPRSSTSLSAGSRPAGGRQAKTPLGRRVRAGHPAQEQVQDGRAVAVGVVGRARASGGSGAAPRRTTTPGARSASGAISSASASGRWCQAVSGVPGGERRFVL